MKHSRRSNRPRRPNEPLFYRSLAQFVGYCGLCNTSFKVGEPIYYCRQSRWTHAMRCHASCYLRMIGELPALRRPDAITASTVNTGNPTTGHTQT